MNNWGFLHLLIRQVHHPHDQLSGNLLLQHAPMPQQQIAPAIQPRTIHTIKAIKQPLLEEELELDELELFVDVVCLFAGALFV